MRLKSGWVAILGFDDPSPKEEDNIDESKNECHGALIRSPKTLYYLIKDIIFLLGKYLVLEITTTKSHMKLSLNKTYSWHW